MTITLIQMNIKWGDIAANCDVASQLIDSQPGSDLYVLPEMFSTGFATEPERISDDSLRTLTWMQEKANAINAAICGSVATKSLTPSLSQGEGDCEYRNRFYFVKPGGEVSYYDKHHLFTYGKEHLRYTGGNERTIVEWRGVRFLLQICYDLRFPIFSRNKSIKHPSLWVTGREATLSEYTKKEGLVRPDYDCAIYVASWPTSRISVWNILLPARAIENQCYALGVNRIGDDPACSYNGGTQAVDAYGRVIALCPDNEQCAITITLDMDKLTAFRKKFPVLSDAD